MRKTCPSQLRLLSRAFITTFIVGFRASSWMVLPVIENLLEIERKSLPLGQRKSYEINANRAHQLHFPRQRPDVQESDFPRPSSTAMRATSVSNHFCKYSESYRTPSRDRISYRLSPTKWTVCPENRANCKSQSHPNEKTARDLGVKKSTTFLELKSLRQGAYTSPRARARAPSQNGGLRLRERSGAACRTPWGVHVALYTPRAQHHCSAVPPRAHTMPGHRRAEGG